MASNLPSGTTFPRGLSQGKIHWPLVPARELFELKYGKALIGADRRPGSVPVYGTNGRCGSHDTALFKGPGVILGRKGQGPLGVEWCDEDYWVIDTAYSLVPLRPEIDLMYAYFLIKFIGLNHLKDGTSNPTLSRDAFGSQTLPWPPVRDQRAIAHILGTLDAKIELNRRMNETLEAMARAIFKSWFVDFDPVRAKAEGRDPCLPNALAELFPDSFEETELREIPKGWRLASLGQPCEVIDCLHTKKPERKDTGRPLLQLGNIREDGLIDMSDSYLIEPATYDLWISRMEASPGDCVITNVGRVGAVAQIPKGIKAALGRNMTGVRCKQDFPFPTFLIECLLSEAMKAEISSKVDSGTILESLNVRNIPRLRFVMPPLNVLQRFEDLARPVRARMEDGLTESHTLAAVRDALLPKLISGEIRITDTDRILKKE